MKLLKPHVRLLLICAMLFAACPCQGQPAEAPAAARNQLDRLVGTWSRETVAHPAEWSPQRTVVEGATNKISWTFRPRDFRIWLRGQAAETTSLARSICTYVVRWEQ